MRQKMVITDEVIRDNLCDAKCLGVIDRYVLTTPSLQTVDANQYLEIPTVSGGKN
jgi:hypothetical protein